MSMCMTHDHPPTVLIAILSAAEAPSIIVIVNERGRIRLKLFHRIDCVASLSCYKATFLVYARRVIYAILLYCMTIF